MALGGVGRRRPRPGKPGLLARGRGVDAGAEEAWRRRLGIHRERAPAQAQQRRGVAGQRRAHGAGEGGAQSRVEVSGQQDREHVHAREAAHPRAPAPVDDPAAQRPARHALHERGEVGHRIARPRASPAAERAERARHGLERVEVERVGPVRLDGGVEHEPLHPRGVAQRVPERDLRAVRGPVQRDPLGAELLPDRIEVVIRVAARVEGPPRTEPPGAGAGGRSGLQEVRALEPPAAEQARAPRTALVEDHEVAVAVGREQHAQRVRPERLRRRLPGPAREHEQRRAGGPAPPSGSHPLHQQRDPARHRAAAVERHAQPCAGEVVRAAALEAERRLSGRRKRQAGREEEGGGNCPAHRPAH